jgi:hypothetical protein
LASRSCATCDVDVGHVYYLFVAAFRAAAERLKLGCKDAVFPDGCFPPPLPFCRSG